MAKAPSDHPLPLVRVRGSHADLGRALGDARAAQIRAAVVRALDSLKESEVTEQELREQNAPYLAAAERDYPGYTLELREMAAAADVPFDVLFRLNCYGSRPRDAAAGVTAGSAALRAKDTTVAGSTRDQAAPAPHGCTSVVSRRGDTVAVGHTEDSSPENIEGLYLLDAEVAGDGNGAASRFLAINYAQTLPGCAAAMNRHGLIVLIDGLPDPDRRVGVPEHFVARALLDLPSIDAAVDHLRSTTRGGGWNFLLVQGQRFANVETTSTRVVVTSSVDAPTYAHSNHFRDETLAAAAGEPRSSSVERLNRALHLVRPDMDLEAMRRLISDREGYPDSICRDRTIGALLADSAARRVEVCWGEPDTGTWTSYTL